MSQNSSKPSEVGQARPRRTRWLLIVAWPLFVLSSFYLAQVVVGTVLGILSESELLPSTSNAIILNTFVAIVIYTITLLLVIGLPWWIGKRRTTKDDLGLQRPLGWNDVVWAPIGYMGYIILTAVLTTIVMHLIPAFDITSEQNTGFGGVTQNYEYVLAFLTLVIVAPIAEEVLFRGFLFGKLRKVAPLWLAVIVTSALFGLAHFDPVNNTWNLVVDTFALSIVMCLLRIKTNGLWAPILLHMIKNGLAFYILFINPDLLNILGA
ncbi:MAG: rane protein of unknown function [Candidatus Saccharibacteria bacterium]|nr:rane protein of unknown function [Candidatus Saccharibacteria bacterium]